jgi:hypothetical protein
MTDDSLFELFGGIAALIALLLTLLYWDRIRAWNGHRRELAKQRRNRQGRA